MAYIRHRH